MCCANAGGRLTFVIQMLGKEFDVAMAPGRDVKIALHLVPLQAAVDAARIRLAPDPRRPLEPAAVPAGLAQRLVHVLVGVAVDLALVDRRRQRVLAAAAPPAPLAPVGLVQLEGDAGQDAVAGGVLDVDVDLVAVHGHDHVDVDLQRVRDALLDREGVVDGAGEPAPRLRQHQPGGSDQQEDGPGVATAGAREVRRLGFGWARG
jgi:hypothetical protein